MNRSTNYTRTQPTTEPVTVGELRTQLLIDTTEHDGDLADMISEARREAETVRCGDVALIDSACVDYFNTLEGDMELHWAPVDSITSVAYLDSNGDSQDLAETVYELGTINGMGVLRLKYDQTWPSTRCHPDCVTVTYKAGYGEEATDVPPGVRRWIKARAAWLYQNRDGEEYPWPDTMNVLLAEAATVRVYGGN